MGINDIMKSRKILLIASGIGKAEIVQRVLCGPITEDVPATVLRLHPSVVFIVDSAAASAL
jgi:glucosamine-6-phosphate deaminase